MSKMSSATHLRETTIAFRAFKSSAKLSLYQTVDGKASLNFQMTPFNMSLNKLLFPCSIVRRCIRLDQTQRLAPIITDLLSFFPPKAFPLCLTIHVYELLSVSQPLGILDWTRFNHRRRRWRRELIRWCSRETVANRAIEATVVQSGCSSFIARRHASRVSVFDAWQRYQTSRRFVPHGIMQITPFMKTNGWLERIESNLRALRRTWTLSGGSIPKYCQLGIVYNKEAKVNEPKGLLKTWAWNRSVVLRISEGGL